MKQQNEFLNLIKQGLNNGLLETNQQNQNKKTNKTKPTKTETETEKKQNIKQLKTELNELETMLKNGYIEVIKTTDKTTNEPKRIFLKHKTLTTERIKRLNEIVKTLNQNEWKKTNHKPTIKIYEPKTDIYNIEYWKLFNKDCLLNFELLKNKNEKLNGLLNENEVKLLTEYNKINLIGLNSMNEYENIENENLKARLLNEYIENFKTNLQQKNSENIKTLNKLFLKVKTTKQTKQLYNFIIDETEDYNIFWTIENWRIENQRTIKRINEFLNQNETFKTINKLGLKKYNKLNQQQQNEIQLNYNKYNKLLNLLNQKTIIKNGYNKVIHGLKTELNQNETIKKYNIIMNRILNKWIIKQPNQILLNGLTKKQQIILKQILKYETLTNELNELNENLTDYYIEKSEVKQIKQQIKTIKNELKLLNRKKLESELNEINETIKTETENRNKTTKQLKTKIYNYYKPYFNEVLTDYNKKYENLFTDFHKQNTNLNNKINRLTDYFKTEYNELYNEYNELYKTKKTELNELKKQQRINNELNELKFNLTVETITK